MWKSMQFEAQVAVASSVVVASAILLWLKQRKNSDPELENTYLHYAMANDTTELRKLLSKKELLKGVADQDKNTALIITLKNGFLDSSKFLMEEFGCSPEAVNSDGWNCFLSACFGGQMELVRLVYDKVSAKNPKIIDEPNFDGWTCLHIGAAKLNDEIVHFGVEKGATVNIKNKAGQTPVLIAACNGDLDLVKYLVSHGADTALKTEKLESPLFLAIRGQHKDIVDYLLSLPVYDATLINSATLSGATALHAAARIGEEDIAEKLIEKGADINAQERDGSTPLHAAVFHNRANIVKLLLSKNVEINTKTRFGTTPLHEAAFYGRSQIVRLLLENGADLNIRDNDGLTPLHITCTASKQNRGGNAKSADHVGVIQALLDHGADVNTLDEGKSTPLYIVSYAGEKGFELVPLLLDKGADYVSENWQGWTALHAAHSSLGYPPTAQAIEEHARAHNPEFLEKFDRNKPRDLTQRKAGPNLELAKAVFGDAGPSLEAIAERIASGKSSKIVVLLGAGISVSAGIPDFRSPDSGIYSQATAQKYKLENPSAAFDIGAIRKDPVPFYKLVKDIFYPVVTGDIKPTATHKFLKALKDHNVLSRIYTQNIDGLEYKVGMEEADVVEAHGSFKKAYCMTCNKPANMEDFWGAIGSDKVPKCAHCGDTVRPAVTFFGEPLPSRFFEYSSKDLRACDELIGMGTSRKVYPFASLVNDVSSTTPRLLFNKNEVGPFVGCAVNVPQESANFWLIFLK
eukprot:Phypoly_transcript_03528.p1 GENE.Phypoly_transcript_03528~~Phypoly_transcript_03528.p1  ORF type:complete len:745 (+),score=126.62 Phypoly_transcript_03528:64-2298(+)